MIIKRKLKLPNKKNISENGLIENIVFSMSITKSCFGEAILNKKCHKNICPKLTFYSYRHLNMKLLRSGGFGVLWVLELKRALYYLFDNIWA